MRSAGLRTDHFPPNQLWYPLFAARTAIGTCSKRQPVFHQRQPRATSAEQMTPSSRRAQRARQRQGRGTVSRTGAAFTGTHREGFLRGEVETRHALRHVGAAVCGKDDGRPSACQSSHGAAKLALGLAGGPTTTHRRSRHSRGNGCGRSRWWLASGCRPAHG